MDFMLISTRAIKIVLILANGIDSMRRRHIKIKFFPHYSGMCGDHQNIQHEKIHRLNKVYFELFLILACTGYSAFQRYTAE